MIKVVKFLHAVFFIKFICCDLPFCTEVIANFPGYTCTKDQYYTDNDLSTIIVITKNNVKEFLQVYPKDPTSKYLSTKFPTSVNHTLISKPLIVNETNNFVMYTSKFQQNGPIRKYFNRDIDTNSQRTLKLNFFLKLVQAFADPLLKTIVNPSLTPDNIFVDDYGNPVIMSFQFAVNHLDLQIPKGSFNSYEPEMTMDESPNYFCDYRYDSNVYYLGVILFYLFTDNSYPFQVQTFAEIREKYIIGYYKVPSNTDLGVLNVISDCLQAVYEKRHTIEKLVTEIKALLATNITQVSIKEFYLSSLIPGVNPVYTYTVDFKTMTKLYPKMTILVIILCVLLVLFIVVIIVISVMKKSSYEEIQYINPPSQGTGMFVKVNQNMNEEQIIVAN